MFARGEENGGESGSLDRMFSSKPGLALGAHPEKTLIVQVGRVRSFSDIAGKHLVRLTNDTARRNELVNRLEKIFGNTVNRKGSDWMTAGDFDR